LARPLKLVGLDGGVYNYTPAHEPLTPSPRGRFETRVAFAAAHVVVDPFRTTDPLTQPFIDWDATIAYREYLWSLGFGVAEAMDTAQRGMGLDWPLALELIKRSTAAAHACGGFVASGAGTDHLSKGHSVTLQDVTDAYLKQCEAIEAVDCRIIGKSRPGRCRSSRRRLRIGLCDRALPGAPSCHPSLARPHV